MKATLFLLLSCFLAIQVGFGQEKTVVAKSGDGIYSLLRKGGINPSSKTVDEFRKLNADKIGKDNRVFIGKSYNLRTYLSPKHLRAFSDFRSCKLGIQ